MAASGLYYLQVGHQGGCSCVFGTQSLLSVYQLLSVNSGLRYRGLLDICSSSLSVGVLGKSYWDSVAKLPGFLQQPPMSRSLGEGQLLPSSLPSAA